LANDRWAYSPLLATLNTVQVTPDAKPTTPKYKKLYRLSESTFLSPLDGSKTPPKGPITSETERRKWLSSPAVRTQTAFPSTYVAGDFSNPFIDFNTFSVHLPYVGLKVDVLKYWTRGKKRQPLRYVCRLRPGVGEETVFFVVLFELVGDAIVHDDRQDEKVNGDGKENHEEIIDEKNGIAATDEKNGIDDDLGVD
jgi:hypothetical protein